MWCAEGEDSVQTFEERARKKVNTRTIKKEENIREDREERGRLVWKARQMACNGFKVRNLENERSENT